MGHQLKRLRLARKWTQQEAADAFGLSHGGYTKIERSTRKLSDTWIKKAAEVYGVSMADVLGEAPARGRLPAASGRRIENIRKALAPELPAALGVGPAEWTDLINASGPIDPDLVMKIYAATKLPPGYIAFGDSAAVPPELLARLLAAALDDPFG